VDGLRAPLVLHPQEEVHAYDDEFTVVLGDWYHDDHSVLMQQFISIANPGGAEPVPSKQFGSAFCLTSLQSASDSGLIYFAQNASYLGPISGTSPAAVTSAVGFNENATLPFEPGKTYRLRIINMSALSAFFFWIDGHNMSIIEVDGVSVTILAGNYRNDRPMLSQTDIEESPTDMVTLSVAQRYSVLVKARNDTSANWAIHVNMDQDMFDKLPAALQTST
jgi:iron transport multicopper oxidase